jgi:sporulation protein YlmC with PRC-barrel domain
MSTTMWNPTRHEDYDTLKGFEVYTSDNEKLGKITEVCHPAMEMSSARGKHYFRVDPGTMKKLFTNADEVFVPERLVSIVEPGDDKVILEVPKSRVEKTDWSRPRDYDTYRRV